MRSSQKKLVAAVAVIVVVVAALLVVFYPKGEPETDDSRYSYNYTYTDVDSIVKIDGSTLEKTAGGAGVKSIRVYTIDFQNRYTSSVSISFSTIKMKTVITNPKDSSADKQTFTADYITSAFSTSASRTVYAGTSDVIQVAFYLKDYSAYASEKSETTVDIEFSSTVTDYAKKDSSLSVPSGPTLQYRTNPTTTAASYTTKTEITLKDDSVRKADDGFLYRIYAINVRSTGDAVSAFDPSSARLNLNVTYNETKDDGTKTTVTKGFTATAVKDYKLCEKGDLVAWTDNNTACTTVYVAFMCPDVNSEDVSSISTTGYMYFEGYIAGMVTGNSKLPSPAMPA